MDALSAPSPRWSLPRRFAFRCCLVYLVLYSLPWPLGWIPGTGDAAQYYEHGSDALLQWFGKHVLGVERDLAPFPTGSGDTTRAYVQLVLQPTIALLAALLWSLVDRRAAHPRLADLLRTWLRYVLASAMLGYGTAKWFSGQFPPLDVDRLRATWGDCSPMGVVWRFMGSSQAYTAFSGVVECLGGVLLLWRRTATLGSLVAIGAMTNVVLINFCYDVPVKLYSSHLLLMAIAILWRDLPRLTGLLIWNVPVPAVALRLPSPRWWFWSERVLKVAAVGFLLYGSAADVVERATAVEVRGPLDGGYEVVDFTADPPPSSDTAVARWHSWNCRRGRSAVGFEGVAARHYFVTEVDENAGTVSLSRIVGPAGGDGTPDPKLSFRWEGGADAGAHAVEASASAGGAEPLATTGPRTLVLEGDYAGARIRVRLRERQLDSFLLCNRGFHWIQEYPYNR